MSDLYIESSVLDLLESAVETGSFNCVSSFLKRFQDCNDSTGYVSELLFSIYPARRLLGFIKYMIIASHGFNPKGASELGPALIIWMIRHRVEMNSQLKDFDQYIASVLFNTCQAFYNTFQFKDGLVVLECCSSNIPEITHYEGFWHGVIFCAKGKFRQLKLEETIALLGKVPEPFHYLEQYRITHNSVEKMRTQRFEVEPPKQTNAKIKEIWDSTLPLLKESLDDYVLKCAEYDHNELARLYNLINRMSHVTKGSLPFEDRIQVTANLRLEFKEAWNKLLQTSSSKEIISYIDNLSDMTESLQYVDDLKKLSAHIHELNYAIDRAASANDFYGQLHMQWCKLLTVIKVMEAKKLEGNDFSVHDSISKLLQSIRDHRLNLSSLAFKASLTNLFPGIVAKAFDLPNSRESTRVRFNACEFQNGRSLLAIKAEETSNEVVTCEKFGLNELGERTHYLSFSVSNHTDKIYSTIYCSNGVIDSAIVDIPASELRKLLLYIDPLTWKKRISLFTSPVILKQFLTPLIALIKRHLTSGNINIEDHICISADDPVYPFPLSYIQINGRMLVEYFSLSYVSSFAEAYNIANARELKKPSRSRALYVERFDEKSPSLKWQRFEDISNSLQSFLSDNLSVNLSCQPPVVLLNYFERDAVIHTDTHGFFNDGKNPYKNAGLVVSDGISKPLGTGDTRYLLTPEMIVDSDCDLVDSHVTLNACVSGLGQAGYGGDVLGLEFALRQKGAESVLASHWVVTGELSHKFLVLFYRFWLKENLKRGEAWRKTIQQLKDQDCASAEEWCFFSLHGNWL